MTEIEQTQRCPLCGARPGERCTNPCGTFYATGVHSGRRQAAVRPQVAMTRRRQLAAYFRLLIGLAEKAEDKQRRDDLFDRIERTIAEVEAEDARQAGSLGQLMQDWAEIDAAAGVP